MLAVDFRLLTEIIKAERVAGTTGSLRHTHKLIQFKNWNLIKNYMLHQKY